MVPEETCAVWFWVIQEAARYAFGHTRPAVAAGLRIRCDNLPVFRDKSFCRMLATLGIRTSYIPPLKPSGNGLAERFVRTLRDNRLAIRSFASLEELGREMMSFREVYNREYILQRWGYRTPAQVRALFETN